MQLKVYYEDKDILVCLKPPGIATQTAGMAERDMVSLVKNHLVRQGAGRDPYLGVVHRLDQPVGGLLIFAKNKNAAASLSRQIREETMNKEYLALCCGRPSPQQAILAHYLKKDKRAGKAVITDEQDKEGKKAVLSYTTEAFWEGCSLLRIRLKTGRFHQIRAQLSAIGNPLLGDKKYGSPKSEREAALRGIRLTALLACSFGIRHPSTEKEMEFVMEREDLPLWCKGEV